MDLLNTTGMSAGYTLGLEPDGRELLVVAVKGTFRITDDGNEAVLADEQLPLVDADVFTGDPGASAPVYECDFAPRKPRCDVLLNGTAYAPGGRPARRVPVSMQVAGMSKTLMVVGERRWRKWLLWTFPGSPKPFLRATISYDVAFGGTDRSHKNPKHHRTYLQNHVGLGVQRPARRTAASLPRTEQKGKPIRRPGGRYRPMAFGPIGRAWKPRVDLAGTYDQKWIDDICPFLPPDFNDAYYQSAPPDQQIPFPKGGEEVRLVNLTPRGRWRFRIPQVQVPITFFLRDDDPIDMQAVIDALVIEPDEHRILITWRASQPLRDDIFEIEQVVAGQPPPGWYRARNAGKVYISSLDDLTLTPRPTGEEAEEDEEGTWIEEEEEEEETGTGGEAQGDEDETEEEEGEEEEEEEEEGEATGADSSATATRSSGPAPS